MNSVITKWLAADAGDRSDFRFRGQTLYHDSKPVAVRLPLDGKQVILCVIEAASVIAGAAGTLPIFTVTADGLTRVMTYLDFCDTIRVEGVRKIEQTNVASALQSAISAIEYARCPLPKRLDEVKRLDEALQATVFSSLIGYRDYYGLDGFNWIVSFPQREDHEFHGSCVQVGWVTPKDTRQPVYLVNVEQDAVEIKLKDGIVHTFGK